MTHPLIWFLTPKANFSSLRACTYRLLLMIRRTRFSLATRLRGTSSQGPIQCQLLPDQPAEFTAILAAFRFCYLSLNLALAPLQMSPAHRLQGPFHQLWRQLLLVAHKGGGQESAVGI